MPVPNLVLLDPDIRRAFRSERAVKRSLTPRYRTAQGWQQESGLISSFWWRRRELNPRPRKPEMKSLRAYPIQNFRAPLQNRQEWRRPSPIDLGLLLRTEALGLSCKMTFTDRRTGSPAGTAA
jgi:hypothetical protein